MWQPAALCVFLLMFSRAFASLPSSCSPSLSALKQAVAKPARTCYPVPASSTRVFSMSSSTQVQKKNVVGTALEAAGPNCGFYRDGYCFAGSDDGGVHAVCAEVTEEFLEFTKSRGNDLSTPRPPSFPGLNPGDRWCLCVSRWKEAAEAGKAPPVVLAATHERALDMVSLDLLKQHATGE